MTLALARAQVKTVVETVSAIGIVHDYERFANEATSADEWFYAQGQVNFAIIRANSLGSTVLTCGEQERVTEFEIEWFLSVQDERASRKTAETGVESLKDALIAARTLGGTVANCTGPISEKIDNRMLHIGDRKELVHRMLVRFQAEERVAVTYA